MGVVEVDKGVFILIDLPGDNMFLMAVCRSGGVLCVLLRLRFFHLLRLVLVTEFCQHYHIAMYSCHLVLLDEVVRRYGFVG